MWAKKLSHGSMKGQTLQLKTKTRGALRILFVGRWGDFLLSAYGFVSESDFAATALAASVDVCSPWRVR